MRTRLLFLLNLSFLVACNSGAERNASKAAETFEAEEAVSVSEMEMDESITTIDYQGIVSEKLQELAELQQLINTHPEFESELREQLHSISPDSILTGTKSESIQISEITPLGGTIEFSDSIQDGVKFSYRITTNNGSKLDSILARFQNTTVEIDGEQFTSTKVTFESLKDQ